MLRGDRVVRESSAAGCRRRRSAPGGPGSAPDRDRSRCRNAVVAASRASSADQRDDGESTAIRGNAGIGSCAWSKTDGGDRRRLDGPAAGRLAGAEGRPGPARSRLHPRQLPGLWLLASLYFRADVRGLDRIPQRRAGAAGRQPQRRQPPAGHVRVHAGVLLVLRRRAAVLPTGAQPGGVDARTRLAAQVRHRRRQPRQRAAGAGVRRRRCWSTRAATTRCSGRRGSVTRSTSAAARAT